MQNLEKPVKISKSATSTVGRSSCPAWRTQRIDESGRWETPTAVRVAEAA
ncbi:MAG TPA: hypothetical protein PLV92_15340 [Pirellulaceae bacterium]|nr:hypothetical protein [Pirellulaceae bacterium]